MDQNFQWKNPKRSPHPLKSLLRLPKRVSLTSLKPCRVSRLHPPPKSRNLNQRVNSGLNPWNKNKNLNQWVNSVAKYRGVFYLTTHQSSVQKIPGIIKWNSLTISVTQ